MDTDGKETACNGLQGAELAKPGKMTAEQRRQAKEARREANRRAWAERQVSHARVHADNGQHRPRAQRGRNGGLGSKVRKGLRMLAHGHPLRAVARQLHISDNLLRQTLATSAGRDYLEAYRARIDAHRILLAATVPFMQLAHAIETGRPQAAVSPEVWGEGEAG